MLAEFRADVGGGGSCEDLASFRRGLGMAGVLVEVEEEEQPSWKLQTSAGALHWWTSSAASIGTHGGQPK